MHAGVAISLLLTTAGSVLGHSPEDKHTNPAMGQTGSLLTSHGGEWQPDYYLSVTYEMHKVACHQRMSVLVNGTSPGPEIRLPPGRTTWIRVCNDMDEYNTTMHWHGLSQRTAPFSDGSPISQWPIAPHKCFDYEVHPESDDAGTYFYHSHVGFQAISSSGPLIVEDPGLPPIFHDNERLVYVQDYYNKSDHEIEAGLVATPFVWSGEVDSVLINGVGVANNSVAGEGDCQLPVIDVLPDTVYRFRFVGATAISMVQIAFEGHSDLEVIAADGQYTKPHKIDYIQISPGQRFDAIIRTKSAEELIRANKTDFLIQYQTQDRPKIFKGYGVLRYPGNGPKITTQPATSVLNTNHTTYDYLEYTLEPLFPNDSPQAHEVTRRVHIDNIQVQKTPNSTITWEMDGLSWTEYVPQNDPPYLVDIYKNGPSVMPNYTAALANNDWDPKTLLWPAQIGEVLEIIIQNTGSRVKNNGGVDYHPYHLHGKHFTDCGRGNGTYNATENEERLKGYSPVLRDTVNLYRYSSQGVAGEDESWRCIRVRVQNPGCWLLHCHILQHMTMGMQMAWVFGDYQQIAAIPFSGAQGYLEYNGNAYGGPEQPPVVYEYYTQNVNVSIST